MLKRQKKNEGKVSVTQCWTYKNSIIFKAWINVINCIKVSMKCMCLCLNRCRKEAESAEREAGWFPWCRVGPVRSDVPADGSRCRFIQRNFPETTTARFPSAPWDPSPALSSFPEFPFGVCSDWPAASQRYRLGLFLVHGLSWPGTCGKLDSFSQGADNGEKHPDATSQESRIPPFNPISHQNHCEASEDEPDQWRQRRGEPARITEAEKQSQGHVQTTNPPETPQSNPRKTSQPRPGASWEDGGRGFGRFGGQSSPAGREAEDEIREVMKHEMMDNVWRWINEFYCIYLILFNVQSFPC